MDIYFNSTLFEAYDYISMLGSKFIPDNKMGPWSPSLTMDGTWQQQQYKKAVTTSISSRNATFHGEHFLAVKCTFGVIDVRLYRIYTSLIDSWKTWVLPKSIYQ